MGLFSKKDKKDKEEKSVAKQADKLEVAQESKKDKAIESKDKAKEVKTEKKSKGQTTGQAYRFLLKPVISEKATVGASENKYTFEVSIDANKVSVKKAVEEVYGVVPSDVNIINHSGKNVRFGRKYGRTKKVKKAIVTLKKGDSIKLYEGI